MRKGIALSVIASALFGVMYYYSPLLSPLSGEQIFGWRMLLTFPFACLAVLVLRESALVRGIAVRTIRQPWLILGLLASAGLLALQLWLFLWAPLHGRGLAVSLGYFLLPLVMVLVGRIFYKERLSPLRRLAVSLACIGAAYELWRAGSLSWEALLVMAGYPCYFALRRWMGTNHLGGLWFDMAIMLPLAAWFAWDQGAPGALFIQSPSLFWKIPLLGLISAAALISFVLASHLLPFGLFGLLSYLEPIFLVAAAVIIGERLPVAQWPMYAAAIAATACLVVESIRTMKYAVAGEN